MKIKNQAIAVFVFVLLLTGCASTPPSVVELSAITSSVALDNDVSRSYGAKSDALTEDKTAPAITAAAPTAAAPTRPAATAEPSPIVLPPIPDAPVVENNGDSLKQSGNSANQKRIALVVGNSSYTGVSPLRNPVNDANAITKALQGVGFEVVLGTDRTKVQLDAAVAEFSNKARGADVALYYYSGHAMQVEGRNWMLPIDAQPESPSDMAIMANPMDTVFKQMSEKAKVSIMMLDACRNNPFATQMASNTRSAPLTRGLSRPRVNGEVYLAFATAPGEVALDGDGDYSPFSEAVLRHIQKPGIELDEMMRLVRRDVKANTSSEKIQQIPWSNSSLTEQFFF